MERFRNRKHKNNASLLFLMKNNLVSLGEKEDKIKSSCLIVLNVYCNVNCIAEKKHYNYNNYIAKSIGTLPFN